jgi:glyoxylase-like metal-dependent hydrolase (beta-lactamase superfamily II)
MRIGAVRIDPIIDGEVAAPAQVAYPEIAPERWEGYERALCAFGRGSLCTLGGFLVRTEDRVIVIDTGIGSKPVYPMLGGGFRSSLAALGVDRTDVTDVLFSHLHLDHIGWATQDGQPTFPNATYRCDRREWDFFCSPDYDMPEWEQLLSHPDEDAATVRLAPVADRFEYWEGDGPIVDGVDAVDAAGHTPGHTVFLLTSKGEAGFLIGDLAHAEPELLEDDWDLVGVHADRVQARSAITRVRQRILADDLPFAAAHFPGLPWGRLVSDGDRTRWSHVKEST